MQCSGCEYPHSTVVWVRHNENNGTTMRRRECLRCGARFTTHEKLKEPRKPNDDRFPHKGST